MIYRVTYETNKTSGSEEIIVEAQSGERAVEWVVEMLDQQQDDGSVLLEISAEEL